MNTTGPDEVVGKPSLGKMGSRILAVDGLRGLAVMLVFCVHFFGTFASVVYGFNFDQVSNIFELPTNIAFYYWLFYSHYGVYLFFCISGFVIARVLSRISTIAGWRKFIVRRLLRIYPAFLFSIAVACALTNWLNGSATLSWRTLAANLLFLNGWFSLNVHAYNNVSWSLFFEFIFYLVFSIFSLVTVYVGRRRQFSLALWFTFAVLLGIFGYPEWFLFIPFGVGAVAGSISEIRMRLWVRGNTNDLIAVIFYFAATNLAVLAVALPQWGPHGLTWPRLSAFWLLGSSLVFTLLTVRVAYGESILSRVFAFGPVAYFGRISFSFFLVHSLIITLVFNIYRIAIGTLSPLAGLCLGGLMFGLSFAVAAMMYRYIEVPAMSLSSAPLSPANTEI